MSDDRDLNFLQRYGYSPLPEPMRLEELSTTFRQSLFNAIWSSLRALYYGVRYRTRAIQQFHNVFSQLLSLTYDELPTGFQENIEILRSIILHGDFQTVLNFVEIFTNYESIGGDLRNQIAELFDHHMVAYRLDVSEKPFRVFARTSKEESDATLQSIEKLANSGFGGALTHLRDANKRLESNDFAGSVHASISAVESVARSLDPSATSLGRALNQIEPTGALGHKAFKKAINSLYGYTSDAGGIRHAIIDSNDTEETNVDFATALFFFNACAAIAGYLSQQRPRNQ